MKSLWSRDDAARQIAEWDADAGADLALQTYATRLLGQDRHLVLHGGGNASVKTLARDVFGDEHQVLCIKGSGRDMAEVTPADMPALRLEPLQRLRKRDTLDDDEMIAALLNARLDCAAPNPSVETLLHAFLPQKFINHTHASAILSLSDQPDGVAICEAVFGARMAHVPYEFSGLALARAAARAHRDNPDAEGLILHHHGIVTFAEDAETAYERMIEMVSLAEAHIAGGRKGSPFRAATLPAPLATPAQVLPMIRGLCAESGAEPGDEPGRMICDFRTSAAILDFVNGADLADYGQRGVVTPDNIIRIKNKPLILPAPRADDLDSFRAAAKTAVAEFTRAYTAYFDTNNARLSTSRIMLPPNPLLALIPGLGLVGLGRDRHRAAIAADLAEEAINVIGQAESIGRFTPLPEETLFQMEYWPPELAKLGATPRAPLAGQVALITGGAGAIGAACATLFAAKGAAVAVLDLDEDAARATAERIGGDAIGIGCDVTDAGSVRAAFDAVCLEFGGLDIVISNAGAAWQGRIGELDDATLRKSFELNFFSHQSVAQNAVRIMLAQGTGGALLFNASKQAINPGANFGAYGLPKAATLFLSRQYALDYGPEGIRSNAVNADRIKSGLLSEDMIKARSKARGLSIADYMAGNLLRQEVTADDVAQAFLHHALALRTTADVTTVDGGNMAAILR